MIVHDVEQGTDEWLALRAGIPTASEFSNIITSKGEKSDTLANYTRLLAAEVYAGKPFQEFMGNRHTERGKALEPEAREYYAFLKDCDVEQVGFITNDARSYGCSPDGLILMDGTLEIKNLKVENHIAVLQYFAKHKRAPSDYIPQTQGQLLGTERQWSDLLFYHPDLPKLVIRQERDEEFINKLRNLLALAIFERDKILEIINHI